MREARHKGRPIVVGTDGSREARAAIYDAAELATFDGVDLHIVGAYKLADDIKHRDLRLQAPLDVVHDLSCRAETCLDVEEARQAISEQYDLVVHTHVCKGSLAHAVRTVAESVHGGIVVHERKHRRFARRRPLLDQPARVETRQDAAQA